MEASEEATTGDAAADAASRTTAATAHASADGTTQPSNCVRLSRNDVILGRGRFASEHDGNIHYRSLVESRLSDYLQARRGDGNSVRRLAMQVVQASGARFLRQQPMNETATASASSKWKQVNAQVAIVKTMQLFRDLTKQKKPKGIATILKRRTKRKRRPSRDDDWSSEEEDEWDEEAWDDEEEEDYEGESELDDEECETKSCVDDSAMEEHEEENSVQRRENDQHGSQSESLNELMMADSTRDQALQQPSPTLHETGDHSWPEPPANSLTRKTIIPSPLLASKRNASEPSHLFLGTSTEKAIDVDAETSDASGNDHVEQSNQRRVIDASHTDAASGISVIRITPQDVLMEQGGHTMAHPGIVQYRELVKRRMHEMVRAPRLGQGQTVIAREIVEAVKRKGGRFIRRICPSSDTEPLNVVWEVVEDDNIIKMILHFIRDFCKDEHKNDAGATGERRGQGSKRENNTLLEQRTTAGGAYNDLSARQNQSHAWQQAPLQKRNAESNGGDWISTQTLHTGAPMPVQLTMPTQPRQAPVIQKQKFMLAVSHVEIDVLRGIGLCGLPVWCQGRVQEAFLSANDLKARGNTAIPRFNWQALSIACKNNRGLAKPDEKHLVGSNYPRSFAIRTIGLLEKAVKVAYRIDTVPSLPPIVSWFCAELVRWAAALHISDDLRKLRPFAYSAEDLTPVPGADLDDRTTLVKSLNPATCRAFIVMAANLSRLRCIWERFNLAKLVSSVNIAWLTRERPNELTDCSLDAIVAADVDLLHQFLQAGYVGVLKGSAVPEHLKVASQARFEWLVEQLHLIVGE
ncbi:hypothetical protein MPSEU_000541700 [Mayamaea pseudoterrestris]|nr:hypothetical protein MPSEU_000541700 [Mayamaea pseudoterrestris]